MTDPCKSSDPNLEDILNLRVWTPNDFIEQCTSAQLGAWDTSQIDNKPYAKGFSMTFVCIHEGTAFFETFGVN